MDPRHGDDTTVASVRVVVTRSGGFAGLRREWSASPADDDAPHWVALIEVCPWDTGYSPDGSVDRFTWRIHARADGADRDATLADAQVTGPWRTLVDEVQSFSPDPAAPPDPAAS
jgi:hypothetical protein